MALGKSRAIQQIVNRCRWGGRLCQALCLILSGSEHQAVTEPWRKFSFLLWKENYSGLEDRLGGCEKTQVTGWKTAGISTWEMMADNQQNGSSEGKVWKISNWVRDRVDLWMEEDRWVRDNSEVSGLHNQMVACAIINKERTSEGTAWRRVQWFPFGRVNFLGSCGIYR